MNELKTTKWNYFQQIPNSGFPNRESHFMSSSSLPLPNCPYHFYTEEQLVCHGLRGHRPPPGPITLTGPLFAVNRVTGQWLLPLSRPADRFFQLSFDKYINYESGCSIIRWSDFQTGPLVISQLCGRLRFQNCHPLGSDLISTSSIHRVISCVL